MKPLPHLALLHYTPLLHSTSSLQYTTLYIAVLHYYCSGVLLCLLVQHNQVDVLLYNQTVPFNFCTIHTSILLQHSCAPCSPSSVGCRQTEWWVVRGSGITQKQLPYRESTRILRKNSAIRRRKNNNRIRQQHKKSKRKLILQK